ncbi:MAG: hypothetical protein JRI68_14735 [Deltaproteobacteria bacterium]|nr:hypothetical protein [Deltaproteobacteria bacterium]
MVLSLVAGVSVILHLGWPLAQDWWLQRTTGRLFNELSHCLLGPPLGPDELPSDRLHAVGLTVTSQQVRGEQLDWPMRCQYFGGELRAELERAGRGHSALARSLTGLEERLAGVAEIGRVNLDDVFVAATDFGLSVRPTGVVTEPPAPGASLSRDDLPILPSASATSSPSAWWTIQRDGDRGSRFDWAWHEGDHSWWCGLAHRPGTPLACRQGKRQGRWTVQLVNRAAPRPLLVADLGGLEDTTRSVVDGTTGELLFEQSLFRGAYHQPPLRAVLHGQPRPAREHGPLQITLGTGAGLKTHSLTEDGWWHATMIGPHALWFAGNGRLVIVTVGVDGSLSKPQVLKRSPGEARPKGPLEGCIQGNTTAVLVRGSREGQGTITFRRGTAWTQPVAVPETSGEFTCGDSPSGPRAVLSDWSNGTIRQTRCTPERCDTRKTQVELSSESGTGVYVSELDGQPLLLWTGLLGELRARRAPLGRLATADDLVVVDHGPYTIRLIGGATALVLLDYHDGRRALRLKPNLDVEPVALAP